MGQSLLIVCSDPSTLNRGDRQGSKGDVHFYFTKDELKGKTIDEVRKELDALAAMESK